MSATETVLAPAPEQREWAIGGVAKPVSSFSGPVIVLLGIPVFFLWRRKETV